MRGGKTKILKRGSGQTGSVGGCLKKRGSWNPVTNYGSVTHAFSINASNSVEIDFSSRPGMKCFSHPQTGNKQFFDGGLKRILHIILLNVNVQNLSRKTSKGI